VLAVARDPLKLDLALAVARVPYGKEQRERFVVSVAPTFAVGMVVVGTVVVYAGRSPLCDVALKPTGPTASGGYCALANKKLLPGSYSLTARFAGSTIFAPAVSAPRHLQLS
jgi:hypothetical protein